MKAFCIFALLSSLPLALCRPGTVASSESNVTSSLGLDTIARAAGKQYFGTPTDASEFDVDAACAAVLNSKGEFGQLPPLSSMKWVRRRRDRSFSLI